MAGIKRARPDAHAAHDAAAMTVQKRPAEDAAPRAKKQKMAGHAKYQPKKYSLNPLKARIRDLRRQLGRVGEDMPANVRVDKERELAACEHELHVAEAERVKQDMIPRYHKVRFFERQKATRFLKKAVKRLNDNTDPQQQAELERQKHVAEVDLNYTLYYPLIRSYISLYAGSKGKDGADGDSKTTRIGGDQAMWELVEKKMEDNTLEALRNGLEWRQDGKGRAASATPSAAVADDKQPKPSTASKAAAKAKKPASKAAKEEDEDEDSDGGFFE